MPAIHQIALLQPVDGRRPPLRFVRSCSEQLPPAVAAALAERTGAPIITAYGMTENSHQASANPLPSDGRVDLATVGSPTGTSVAVRLPDGTPADPGEVGEVLVTGPALTSGYLDEVPGSPMKFGTWNSYGAQHDAPTLNQNGDDIRAEFAD